MIRYDEVDFADEALRLTDGVGVDYIVDGVAGSTFRGDLRALADRGVVCVFGIAGGLPESFSPMELFPRSLTLTGGSLTNFMRTRDEVLRKAADLWSARRAGWLVPVVDSVRPLADAAAGPGCSRVTRHRRQAGARRRQRRVRPSWPHPGVAPTQAYPGR